MKISGNIEISGINRVVFYRKNLFDRVMVPHNSCYWYDFRRKRRLSNNTMMNIIKSMAANPTRKVWVHGSSINIERVKIKSSKVLGKVRLEVPIYTNTVRLVK